MNGNKIEKRSILFIILIINFLFILSAKAQSKHVALWQIGYYYIDFNTTPPQYIKLPNDLIGKSTWYTDLNGEMKIVMTCGKMYFAENKKIIKTNSGLELSVDLVEIDSQYEFSVGCFIPVPNNRQQIFYIESDKYYLIDIQQKTIKLQDENINLKALDYLKVHQSDCDKIWLINTDKEKWTYYLLDSDGIKKIKDITLNPSEYKNIPQKEDWQINLSKDCKHYTMNNMEKKHTEVYYGDFDRENAVFTRKSSYDFGNKYSYIANSFIAPDNSRIYYFVKTKDGYAQLIEVPIKNGIPDYNSISQPIYSEKNNMYYYRSFDYAYDGKLYLIDYLKDFYCIEINKYGKTVLTSKNKWEKGLSIRNHPFLSSWFMDNPCEEKNEKNPCATQKPLVEFNNAQVCYGQPLKLKISGTAPFEIYYTINGEEKVLKTSQTEYLMPNISGKYKITKIKDSVCESIPTENNISEIANEIKELKIIAE
jgi:hypothetical protein